jgi:hypothetical protein
MRKRELPNQRAAREKTKPRKRELPHARGDHNARERITNPSVKLGGGETRLVSEHMMGEIAKENRRVDAANKRAAKKQRDDMRRMFNGQSP